jgi:PAS domain S-box-containing protein
MQPSGLAEPGRDAEDRYRTLVHHSVDVIAVLDQHGVRRYLSPAVFGLLGYHADELLGGDAFDLVHPDDLARAREAFAEVMSSPGAMARVEMRARRADGTYVECEVIGCNQLTNPVVNGIIVNIRDVSERKREEAERLSLQRQLAEARKQESVSVLAGGLAHELNNLMTAVLGYASLAGMQVARQSPLTEYLGAIEQAAGRAAELCRKLLAFAGGPLLTRPVDLTALVRDAEVAMRAVVPSGADLSLDLAATLPPINADPEQVGHVLMSLIHNAAESLPEGGGTIRVRTSVIDAGEGDFQGMTGYEDPPAGRYVVLEVEDTGCGMDDETRERAFEPFFTTKFPGRGLGLAAVLGIVRSHYGVVGVQSEPGLGSKFRVYLPAREPGA